MIDNVSGIDFLIPCSRPTFKADKSVSQDELKVKPFCHWTIIPPDSAIILLSNANPVNHQV